MIYETILAILSLVVIISIISLYLIKVKFKPKMKRSEYPKDTVILHQVPRGIRAPSASPFCLKLETWLRMAGVPYKNLYSLEFSSKGQVPFITYNGEDVNDSQFCIEYLSKKLDIDLNKNLNNEQKAVCRAFFKMTEESLKWQIGFRRFIFNRDSSEAGIPLIILWLFMRRVKKAVWLQGYGRHNENEIIKIGKDDLKAINDYISDKKYLMGNEVCDTDACLFGMLCQFIYHDKGPLNSYIKNECPNILRYVNTIKETYWKDWDDCLKRKRK